MKADFTSSELTSTIPGDVPNRGSFAKRYSLPAIEERYDPAHIVASKQARIRELLFERKAILLAHNYQRPEVQAVADLVGDSLGLSREAARSNAEVIVFCGVHFMAETAAILAPDKTVLLPTRTGDCSLAASITVEELREWKARYPDAIVVAYVNTSAAIKAEVDFCCTSSNAAAVVTSIDPDRPVLFVPDRFLASVVAMQTGRKNLYAYPGSCHVHELIDPEYAYAIRRARPDMELLIHPECGCASACMQRAVSSPDEGGGTFFLSTEGMFRHVESSTASAFAIGTEVGILSRLRARFPDREFVPVNPDAVCAFMKSVTLDSIVASLETMEPTVSVAPELAARARLAVDRMLAIG